MLEQLFFQFRIVFDDAIMHTDYFGLDCTKTRTATVAGYVRMCIGLARFTVRCPTGMANTAGSFQGISIIRFFN